MRKSMYRGISGILLGAIFLGCIPGTACTAQAAASEGTALVAEAAGTELPVGEGLVQRRSIRG